MLVPAGRRLPTNARSGCLTFVTVSVIVRLGHFGPVHLIVARAPPGAPFRVSVDRIV
jgi:hypothetical protein